MRNLILALSLLLLFAFSANAEVVAELKLKFPQNPQANSQNLYSQNHGKVKAKDGTRRKSIQPNLAPPLLFPIDRIFAFFIQVLDGPPGATLTFEVFQTNPGIVGFANLSIGPYLERIKVQVKIDEFTRVGFSDDFFVKGLQPGETIFTACTQQLSCVINPQPVTVASIVAVEFEQLTGPRAAAELSDNPTDLGGGKRIFPDADSPTGVTRPRVGVKIEIKPAKDTITIFLRSFDVDDSANLFNIITGGGGGDNQGPKARGDFPSNGTIQTSVRPIIEDGRAIAHVVFSADSMQPGDNYKITATIDPDVKNALEVVNGQSIRDKLNNQILSPSDPTDTRGKASRVSQLLTVWRKLHVEVDSMPDLPPNTTPVGDQAYAERNFIKGSIIGIAQNAKELTVLAESTIPQLLLDDGSPNLTGRGSTKLRGDGRFQNGTIIIGSAADRNDSPDKSLLIAGLEGNGVDQTGEDFVKSKVSVEPRFSLEKSGLRTIEGRVKALSSSSANPTRISFRLDEGVRGDDYVGGTLTVGGTKFSVVQAKGPNITTDGAVLSFILSDDDATGPPFLQTPPIGEELQALTAFEFMQISNNPSKNLFAPAYVRPDYIGGGSKTPSFKRNIVGPLDERRIGDAEDFPSTQDFWVVYLQGAFQGRNITDSDPDFPGESAGLGVTSDDPLASLKNIRGSAIFRETITDFEKTKNIVDKLCLKITTVHESGHQFGLEDNTGGIMNQGCPIPDIKFTAEHLKLIRTRQQPQN